MDSVSFWILAWVFAVQQPDGEVIERLQTYANKYTAQECIAQRDEFAAIAWLENLTPEGGDALYSRFVCIPVPE